MFTSKMVPFCSTSCVCPLWLRERFGWERPSSLSLFPVIPEKSFLGSVCDWTPAWLCQSGRPLQGESPFPPLGRWMERGTGCQSTGNPRAPLSLNLRLGWMYSLLASFPGASQVALVVKNPPASAGDMGSIPGLERSPGGGHGKPLQYSCLENPMDRGAWQTIVHGVAKSQS